MQPRKFVAALAALGLAAVLFAPSSAHAFDVASPITQTRGTIGLDTVPINKGGTGQTTASAAFNALSPMTTAGDIIVGGSSGAGQRLAIGSANLPLKVNAGGTALEYGALAIAGGGTGQTTQTAAFDALGPGTTKGDIIVYNGTDHVRLGVGSNGQVVSANSGTATGLEWTSATGLASTSLGGRSQANVVLGSSGTVYFNPFSGEICDTEAPCRAPVGARTFNSLMVMTDATQTASNVTVVLGHGDCDQTATYSSHPSVTVSATAFDPVTSSSAAFTTTNEQCIVLKGTTGGSAFGTGLVAWSWLVTA